VVVNRELVVKEAVRKVVGRGGQRREVSSLWVTEMLLILFW